MDAAPEAAAAARTLAATLIDASIADRADRSKRAR
jgi:hypothetical protein